MSKARTLYSIRPNGDGFAIAKLDEDFEPIQYYNLIPDGKGYICDCPAHTPWCRHKQMHYTFKKDGKLESGLLYDFDAKEYVQPQEDPNG